jgi:hypothetical protein
MDNFGMVIGGLEKNSTQDTIDTNWVLSFDLTAMNIDKDLTSGNLKNNGI